MSAKPGSCLLRKSVNFAARQHAMLGRTAEIGHKRSYKADDHKASFHTPICCGRRARRLALAVAR